MTTLCECAVFHVRELRDVMRKGTKGQLVELRRHLAARLKLDPSSVFRADCLKRACAIACII